MSISIANTSRLKSKKKIGLLFEKGKRLSVGPLHLRYLEVDRNEDSLFGFSVPKKNHALAVHRNRIKRLMRESLRIQNDTSLEKGMLFMFIYLGKTVPEYEELCELMNNILKKRSNETVKLPA